MSKKPKDPGSESGLELIIRADGKLMVPRGCRLNNEITLDLLKGIVDTEALRDFFGLTEHDEIFFSSVDPNVSLCG